MRDRVDVKTIRPLVSTVGVAAVGAGLQWWHPVSLGPLWLVRLIGVALIVASVALVLAAARSLVRVKTAFDMRRATTRLALAGPRSISRNPVYLASDVPFWGVGSPANALFVALSALPGASLLCLLVIRQEGHYQGGKFGLDYAAYCGTVRRQF
ncbi:MAG: hypothetical protein OXU20_39440 [Myxococcales bacterium]|nr:hypothetical protein [Myxococcales bacterium]